MKNVRIVSGIALMVVFLVSGFGAFADQWDPADDFVIPLTPTAIDDASTSTKTHGPHTIGSGDTHDHLMFGGVSGGDEVEIWISATSTEGSSVVNYPSLGLFYDDGSGIPQPLTTDVGALSKRSDGNWQYNGVVPPGVNEVIAQVVGGGGSGVTTTYTFNYKKLIGSRTVSSIKIVGPSSVNENSSTDYIAEVTYSDGEKAYPEDVEWSVSGSLATIKRTIVPATAKLSTLAVSSDTDCTITASFGGVSGTCDVTILDGGVSAELSFISISGSPTVNDNSTEQYTCIATYSDDSTADKTSEATWTLSSPNYASISDSGLLDPKPLTGNQSVTVQAAFGGETDTYDVTIVATSTPKEITSIAITGAFKVLCGFSEQFFCTATYSDGTTGSVSPTWSLSDEDYASLDNAGTLSSDTYLYRDKSIVLTASLGEMTATRTVTLVAFDPDSYSILGPQFVDEGIGAYYTASGTGNDGTIVDLTSHLQAREPSMISPTDGHFAPEYIDKSGEGRGTYINLYYLGKITKQIVVYINDTMGVSALNISGLTSVNENSSVQLSCSATYYDGTTSEVSESASWSCSDTNLATINSGGLLRVGEVKSDTAVTVTARYEKYGSDVTKSYVVTIAEGNYSGGSGTQADPFLLANKEDLLLLGSRPFHYDKHFKMIADIDLAGEVFTNAVMNSNFEGVFDGNGKTIRNLNFDCGSVETDGVGLFSLLSSNASIIDLGLKDVTITHSNMLIASGSLCGRNYGIILRCRVTGVHARGSYSVGGLCGDNYGSVYECYAKDIHMYSLWNCGGVVGYNGGAVVKCYAHGDLSGKEQVGGVCGGNRGTLVDCYSMTTIPGVCAVIWDGGTVSSSFWNASIASSVEHLGDGVGKTTAEMNFLSTFSGAGWDFSSVWKMSHPNSEFQGYPVLRWQDVREAPALSSISLSGPISINEGEEEQYACVAHYGDGETKEVTLAATISLSSPFAAVSSAGTVLGKEVVSNETVTLIAEYQGKVTQKTIQIVDIPPVYSITFDTEQVDYWIDKSRVQVSLTGRVVDQFGNPGAGLEIAAEDPVARMSVAVAAVSDEQGYFTYTTEGINPGIASLFRFVTGGYAGLYMIPFENIARFEYVEVPGETVTIGNVSLDGELTTKLNFVNFVSTHLDSVMEFGQEVQEAALQMTDLLAEGAKEEPVLAGASGIALVSCGITAVAPNPASGGVCAASVVYLKIAVPVTVIKYASFDAIDNSSLSTAKKQELKSAVSTGAFVATVMTGSGWYDVAGVAWESYSFSKSFGSGTDEYGRTYTEFEVEDPNGEKLVVRMMTAIAPPEPPTNPQPAHGRVDVDRDVVLSWEPSERSEGYEVWFGNSSASLRKVASIAGTKYEPGLREAGATFSWKVVATNYAGSTDGADWTFTTVNSETVKESVGSGSMEWSTSSNVSWFVQSEMSHDGISAMQSGAVGDNEESILESSVTGPGQLSFWWRTSSAPDDVLYLYVDNQMRSSVSGQNSGWSKPVINISEGTHSVQWIYRKDGSGAVGSDCGWLDDVQWEGVNRTVYPLSGFDSKWTASFLWDYEVEEWIELGQEQGATELVLKNLKPDQWYWLCVMEYDGANWNLVHGSWVSHIED
jgi:hypothetical protein